MKLKNIKFEISQSTKTINFLDVCITLNQQTLSTILFSKPTDAHIYLNPKSFHPEHMIKNIPQSQFPRLCKICLDASDYIKKSNEYLNFFIKQGYVNFKLKMLAKYMLAKTCDELLTRKRKSQNEKTIKVTTWHPALKDLSDILQEKYHQHINILKRTSTLNKYSQRNQQLHSVKQSPAEISLLEQISSKQMTKRNLK